MTSRALLRRRLGFTMIETLIVMGVAAVLFALAVPQIASIKTSTTLRTGRQQLSAAFSAARSASLQKGKTSTLTMDGSTARVSVMSGLNASSVNVFGPVRLDGDLGITLTPIAGAPTSLNFDARGMLTPTPAAVLKYQLSAAGGADTLCISPAGVILPSGCRL